MQFWTVESQWFGIFSSVTCVPACYSSFSRFYGHHTFSLHDSSFIYIKMVYKLHRCRSSGRQSNFPLNSNIGRFTREMEKHISKHRNYISYTLCWNIQAFILKFGNNTNEWIRETGRREALIGALVYFWIYLNHHILSHSIPDIYLHLQFPPVCDYSFDIYNLNDRYVDQLWFGVIGFWHVHVWTLLPFWEEPFVRSTHWSSGGDS